jgi:hypothetical protein
MSKNITNKIAIIAILLISFLGMNLQEGKGQCPTGFTFTNMTITINGCAYNVPVCYKCAPTALDAAIIEPIIVATQIDPNCNQTWDMAQVIAAINVAVRERIYLSQLCEVRPCNQPPKSKMLFRQYACWEYRRDTNGNLHLQACTNNAICETEYEVCFDGTDFVWSVLTANWYNSSEPTCIFPTIPVWPPTPTNSSSGCFRMPSPCDTEY